LLELGFYLNVIVYYILAGKKKKKKKGGKGKGKGKKWFVLNYNKFYIIND